MPAGVPYFAWIDASETTFGPEHERWDENVFSFDLKQEEGDPASLTVVVRRPRNEAGDPIGLLGPGRKIWAWFALDCGPGLFKFRGRLVGVPTSIFEELVTLEFVARPFDVVAQKKALADTLRVLPHYDEIFIDKERRKDPDVVLEGYTKIWHFDRETLLLTVSDEISGEDGLVQFNGTGGTNNVLFDGLALTLTSGPLARVDIAAEFNWKQQGTGGVDLTNYLLSHWPGATGNAMGGSIPQLNAADWPKIGAGIGDGWAVVDSSATDTADFTMVTKATGATYIVKWADGSSAQTTFNESISSTKDDRNLTKLGIIVVQDQYQEAHAEDGDGLDYVSSWSRNYSDNQAAIGVQSIWHPKLVAGFSADRPRTEKVSFSLFADVQHILTDPADGESLKIDDFRSVDLSDPKEGMPIGDPRRRSYITTERGNRSLEHLIAFARAHLMKRARVVEITFAPQLERMPEITLRKDAFLVEPRVGLALGKVIRYSIALDGSEGRINCLVTIGCAIGRGGSIMPTAGTPSYATADYVGADYQYFADRTVVIDTSVGYQPPQTIFNDDGIDFLSRLKAEDVIEVGLTVEHGPDPEDPQEITNTGHSVTTTGELPTHAEEIAQQIAARDEYIRTVWLPSYETRAKFKLKSMKKIFESDYVLQVTDLKIPTGYDLEAA